MSLIGRTAALHIAFWQYDPWYRRAWFVWPQATAILLAAWLVGDRTTLPIGKWAKPADCTNPSNPGCAATKRVMLSWSDEAAKPTIANQTSVTVDRSALRSSAAADQPKLLAALGAYYRGEWAKAARSTFPSSHIHLVEPLPKCIDCLREMAAIDGRMTVRHTQQR